MGHKESNQTNRQLQVSSFYEVLLCRYASHSLTINVPGALDRSPADFYIEHTRFPGYVDHDKYIDCHYDTGAKGQC